MKVLLYGGTFDPPHVGHLNNLRAVMAAVRPDRVIVMPAGVPPHKAASSTPGELRLEMCRCFTELDPEKIEVSRWEIDRPGRSYTVDTLEMLHARWTEAELYLAMGSDMLCSFTHWRSWQRILQLATLAVQSRETGDAAELQAAAEALKPYGGRVVFAAAPAMPCASHDIRDGKYPQSELAVLLPESARQVIARAGLYFASEETPEFV